jgi:glutathione S-transferase
MNSPILFFKKGTCSLGSVISAEWSGLPYRLCQIDEQNVETKTYQNINPLGEVPAMQVEDILLTESIALLHFWGKKDFSKGLSFPQETNEFDKMNQVLSYLATDFKGSFHNYFSGGLSEEETQKEIMRIREQYEYVNQYLVREGFIFGQKTIADAYLFGLARWGNGFFKMEEEFPNIARFQKEMNEDPGVQFALAQEEGTEAQSSGAFEGRIELDSPESHFGNGFPGLQINRKTGKNEDLIAS